MVLVRVKALHADLDDVIRYRTRVCCSKSLNVRYVWVQASEYAPQSTAGTGTSGKWPNLHQVGPTSGKTSHTQNSKVMHGWHAVLVHMNPYGFSRAPKEWFPAESKQVAAVGISDGTNPTAQGRDFPNWSRSERITRDFYRLWVW